MSTTSKRLFILLILSIVAIFAYRSLDLLIYGSLPRGLSNSTNPVYIEVPKGARIAKVAEELESQGIISDASKFQRLGRYYLKFRPIKAGEYQVSPTQNPFQVFRILTSGISSARAVTIKEGDNMYQIGALLEQNKLGKAKDFVDLCKSKKFMFELGMQEPLPVSLEGTLFPDTYFFNRTMSLSEMIHQMRRKHLALWDEKRLAQLKAMGMTQHELVTLASIIEKETGAPEERPLISSVFHNRLKKRMRLQSDPTTIYGIWSRYKGNIHRSDLHEKTPFNTYAIPALPLGPISNPGKEAVDAALHPATSDFLFFVSKNNGTHYFSRNLKEHEHAVGQFQLDPSAREGKSWRDLKSRPTHPVNP